MTGWTVDNIVGLDIYSRSKGTNIPTIADNQPSDCMALSRSSNFAWLRTARVLNNAFPHTFTVNVAHQSIFVDNNYLPHSLLTPNFADNFE